MPNATVTVQGVIDKCKACGSYMEPGKWIDSVIPGNRRIHLSLCPKCDHGRCTTCNVVIRDRHTRLCPEGHIQP